MLGALITRLVSSWQLCESQTASVPGTFFMSNQENLERKMSGVFFFLLKGSAPP